MLVYKGRKFEIESKNYSNGRIALILNKWDEEMGYFAPYTKMTVNIPEIQLEDSEIVINCDVDNDSEEDTELVRILKFTGIARPVKPYKRVSSPNSFKTYMVFKLNPVKLQDIIDRKVDVVDVVEKLFYKGYERVTYSLFKKEDMRVKINVYEEYIDTYEDEMTEYETYSVSINDKPYSFEEAYDLI